MIFERVKPTLVGVNLVDNTPLTTTEILSFVGQIAPVDGYREIPDSEATCPLTGRARKLVIETETLRCEAYYYQPFTVLNWNDINSNFTMRVETLPEFINGDNLYLILRKLNWN